jgi:hypothetical protein
VAVISLGALAHDLSIQYSGFTKFVKPKLHRELIEYRLYKLRRGLNREIEREALDRYIQCRFKGAYVRPKYFCIEGFRARGISKLGLPLFNAIESNIDAIENYLYDDYLNRLLKYDDAKPQHKN